MTAPLIAGTPGPRLIIGIDNGVTGGLVALAPSGWSGPVAKIIMPTQAARKGREVDIPAVKAWLASLACPWNEMRVVIEEPGGSQSASAAASMAYSFGALRGALAWAGIAVHRVTPHAWHKKMLGRAHGGDMKPLALAKVRELWPSESWLASPRCRVPDAGLYDAALIALYWRELK